MKKITVKAFLKALLLMLGWGYVLGGQGETYSKELAQKWGASGRAGKDLYYFTVIAAGWFGKKIVDCSGMIIQAIRTAIPGYTDQTADGLYSKCKVKGPIASMPEMPGICVHKSGHIGVYLGNGKVIEARGVAYGVVITQLKDRPWTGWGELADVDYATEPVATPTFHISKILKKGMEDPEVMHITRNLTALGFLNRDCTSVFDDEVKKAVKAFQRKYKLTEDGEVGPITTAALGGVWDGK